MEVSPNRKILPVFVLIDVSASMQGSSISAVNRAMPEAYQGLIDASIENPFAELQVELITFGSSARVVTPLSPPGNGSYTPLDANDNATHLGEALLLLKDRLAQLPKRVAQPVVVILSDGQPNDNWQDGLTQYRASTWGKPGRALTIGISVAGQAGALADVCDVVKDTSDAASIGLLLNWATVTVSKSMSSSMAGGVAALPPAPSAANDVF